MDTFDSEVWRLGNTEAASLSIEVLTRVCTTASSLDRCGLTTCWIPETSGCSFVQKFGATPKANSDDVAPPGSQEPCLHRGLNSAGSEPVAVVVYSKMFFLYRMLHKDAPRMARKLDVFKHSEFRVPCETRFFSAKKSAE